MTLSNPEFAACTIIARNYLPMARALAESWSAVHPDCPFFVLLLDSPQGFFRPELEPFQTVLVSELEIPNLEGFLFKYTVLEASTAVKPYLLSLLFRKYSIKKLLYLDPDIIVYKPLDPLREALDDANFLLTPHLLSPLPADGCGQNDHDILQAGTYNLGFLGIRNSIESKAMLRWWCDKLYHHCIVSFKDNLFVDQRWMDMAPGLFDGVRIIRDPGFNVAYWNLHERTVSVDDTIKVNGAPLYFFHFSGFDPNKPWIVSKHQNRFDMKTIGDTRKLYSQYHDLLINKGWAETSMWPYGHDFFSNGLKIPSAARQYYWSLGPDVAHLGNPFQWLADTEPAVIGDSESQDLLPFPSGVNLLGYFESEKGVGEGARSNLRIIRATGLPYRVNNRVDSGSQNVERVTDDLLNDNPFLVNFITLNADGLQEFGRSYASYLRGHFNVGYWAWELPEFPPEWASSFGYANEIWTPSRFTRDSVASRSPIPVQVVPHSLELEEADGVVANRADFGIADDVFLFLYFFDFHSFLERKNPLGLIQAYKKTFGKRKDVQLLIKSSHSAEHQRDFALLQRASEGTNVRIFDAVLNREEKQSLMKSADCYVSLHRSEGFGLTMAESMMYGKPVIATAYSGNVDFMSDDDSFLVPYRLITIDQTHGPYKAGYHWADPDLDHACDLMRHVEANREAAKAVGAKARQRVATQLHPATIAAGVRARLAQLGLAPQAETAAVETDAARC
jgi:glycosyltransferase involved in cell wall biosynthesis